MTHIGRLIARGNTTDVYAWGEHAVVKILREGIPKAWAEREATTTALVNDAGLPAPGVGDVVVVGGRPGVVFERVDGPVMWDLMLADPDDAPRLCRLLAQLQAEVNATAAPSGLPTLRTRLQHNIEAAVHLEETERAAAFADLAGLTDGATQPKATRSPTSCGRRS